MLITAIRKRLKGGRYVSGCQWVAATFGGACRTVDDPQVHRGLQVRPAPLVDVQQVAPGQLTRDQVLAWAAEEQLDVTRHKLERWVRAGLLPRPTTENLGGRSGKRSVYPSHILEQLTALIDALGIDRRLERAGFLLWWWGYEVRVEVVRGCLTTIADSWDEAVFELAALAEDEIALKHTIEESSTARVRNTAVGRVRRRVGRKSFPTIFRILTEVASGRFEGLHADYATEEDEGLFFERAIGLGRARTDSMPDGTGPWLNSDPEQNLADLSSIMSEPLSRTVSGASDDELAAARDEVSPIVQLLATISSALEAEQGPGAFGVTELGRLLGGLNVNELAQFFAIWLRLRTRAELRQGIEDMSTASREALARLAASARDAQT